VPAETIQQTVTVRDNGNTASNPSTGLQ